MKLATLHLKAVGPFTDVVIELSGGEQGLHLIHGPNEAGKTSTLRALSHLLFGFPHLSADNFVHPNEQLRIGGTLRHSDGEELEIVRRRGKSSLRGRDDSTVIPEERLARFLAGISQETFETLFGIDHARLARAGEEIRTGQGHLGEMLFAAGAGLAGLNRDARHYRKGSMSSSGPKVRIPVSTRPWPIFAVKMTSSSGGCCRPRSGRGTTAIIKTRRRPPRRFENRFANRASNREP